MPIDPVPADTPLSRLPNFDPRAVEVTRIDVHLPALARDALAPGRSASALCTPRSGSPSSGWNASSPTASPPMPRCWCPIVMRERPTMLLTERATHLSMHSGQVAFPGGKSDETDRDAAHTALREAHEEVGLDERFVEVVGTLPTYTTGTQFIVTPVVALVQPGHTLTPNAFEVADVFEVPLDFLMNPAHHRHHAVEFAGVRREWLSMPYMDGSTERFIWGATAGMLRNFYRFLLA